jgi:K+-sensing histidine kinase KdpD
MAGLAGVAVVTLGCLALGDLIDNTITALLLLVPIAACSVLGGWRRSVVVSFAAALTYALAFLPPIGHVRIGLTRDVFVLLTFEVVALVVGLGTGRRRSTDGGDDVLRAVSHDLRTPLSTIRAASTDLLAGVHTDESTRSELLGLVVSESERLDRIVGNLLSHSRVRSGTLVPVRAPVALDVLLEASAARMRRLAAAPVVVDVEPDLPSVACDAVLIDQVLANLIENAARHAPAGAPITLHARRRDDLVEVAVEDAGPGFSTEGRRQAFQPSRSPDGAAGIGLAVCKAVVEAHGGTISIRGGSPTTVAFTLPR